MIIKGKMGKLKKQSHVPEPKMTQFNDEYMHNRVSISPGQNGRQFTFSNAFS